MEYRYLGNSGLQVSALSFGSWVTFGSQVGLDLAVDCMSRAFDAGVNFFDNAEVYSDGASEELMGQALKKLGWSRDEYLVSTKIFWGGQGVNQRGLSRKHIIEGTNKALKRFDLEYVDLIYCHRPDLHTPVEETVRAMNHIIDQGKALYWGTSEWSADRIREAISVAKANYLIPPLMEQPQYHMFHRERVEVEYQELYTSHGLGLTTWSPLASGILTGKYSQGIPDGSRLSLEDYGWLKDKVLSDEGRARIERVKKLEPLAKELDCTLAQLAIAWCMKNPRVSTVITGASRAEQVSENMKSLEVYEKLDDTLMTRLESLLESAPRPEEDFR